MFNICYYEFEKELTVNPFLVKTHRVFILLSFQEIMNMQRKFSFTYITTIKNKIEDNTDKSMILLLKYLCK